MNCNSLTTICFQGLLYPPKLYPIFNRTKIQHLFNNHLPHPMYKFISHPKCFASEKVTKERNSLTRITMEIIIQIIVTG